MKKRIRLFLIFAVTSVCYFAYAVASWASQGGQAGNLISPASWLFSYQPEIPEELR